VSERARIAETAMGRQTIAKLIGAAIGIAIAIGWPIVRSWHTESSSPCAQVLRKPEIERLTGKQIDKFAGHDRDYGCTAAWFAVRKPLDETGELLRVEMNRINGHFAHITKDPLWLRDVRKTEALEGVGERAVLLEKGDGSHAVFAEAAGVTIEMYFRREFPRDKTIEIARGADLQKLVEQVKHKKCE
jgi:hypothetical protein